MKQIILDGKKIENEIEIHNILAKNLNFPDYYGKNIHALWDILSTYTERPFLIKWINANISRQKLGRGFDIILDVFIKLENLDNSRNWKEKFTLIIED